MVGTDNNSNEHKFMVSEDDVQSHAPVVFECLRAYYNRLETLSKALVEPGPIAERLEGVITMQGVLPGEGVAYEAGLLANDQFRLTVVFHLCISTWMGYRLSWEEYITLFDLLENAILEDEKNRPEPISPQSTILKLFDVSPATLPKTFLQRAQVVDEFSTAVSLIHDEVVKARPAQDNFDSFPEYYEYMQKFVKGLIKALNDRGMYSTHELERFTLLAMAMRNGLPRFDVPYVMHNSVMPTPTKVIRHMLLKIMRHTHGLEPGEDIGDGVVGDE